MSPGCGTKRTCRPRCATSAFRGKAENICSHRAFPVLTPSGHRPYWVRDFVQQVMTIAVLGCFHASGGSANEASRFHRALEWCNGSLAAPCTRATTGDAGDWLPRYRLARHGGVSGGVPSGTERSRLRRGPERDDRLSLGGG